MRVWRNWQTQGTSVWNTIIRYFIYLKILSDEFGQADRANNIIGRREQVRSNSNAECVLNGETFPNGNTVPNVISLLMMYVRREYTHTSFYKKDEDWFQTIKLLILIGSESYSGKKIPRWKHHMGSTPIIRTIMLVVAKWLTR